MLPAGDATQLCGGQWAAPTAREALPVGNKKLSTTMPPVLDVETFFLSHDVPAANVTDQMCILGHVFHVFGPSQQRYLHAKERDHIDSSLALVSCDACLPLCLSLERIVMATGPLPKVQLGWLMHIPPANVCDRFQSAIRNALNEPERSCVYLRNISRS